MATLSRKIDTQAFRGVDTMPGGVKIHFFKNQLFPVVVLLDGAVTSVGAVGHPTHDAWQALDEAGDFDIGVMTSAETDTWNLVTWFEFFLWAGVARIEASSLWAAASDVEKKKILCGYFLAETVAATAADAMAIAYIDDATKPSYLDTGLSDAPGHIRKLTGRM